MEKTALVTLVFLIVLTFSFLKLDYIEEVSTMGFLLILGIGFCLGIFIHNLYRLIKYG